MQIGVIAPGAMGAAVAQRLARRGGRVAVTLAGRSAASARRAEGLAVLPGEAALAGACDLVLSILPPGEALALAARLAPALRPGTLYADCNAVSPETVRLVAAAVPAARFVDIGIIGGPPGADDAGPKLYASGAHAPELAFLRDHGIDLRPIPGGVGAASALKMSYAGITKGLTAIGSAMALGAVRAGAGPALLAELADSQPQVLDQLRRGMPGMYGKAYRWVAEMEEIAAFLGDAPFAPAYRAAARHYEAIAADHGAPAADGAVAALSAFFAGKQGDQP